MIEKWSAIMITVENKAKVSKLWTKGLRFGKAPKIIEKYCKARLSLGFMICLANRHNQLWRCSDRTVQCTIYAGVHKWENHKCGVNGYIVKKNKICVHVVTNYVNCETNY